MIQIQEKDCLWRFYRRYYNIEVPPAPRNLCNYFWKAMGGFLQYLFYDINAFISIAILGSLTGGFILCSAKLIQTSDTIFLGVVFAFLTLLSGVGTVSIIVVRIGEYIKDKSQAIKVSVLAPLLFLLLGFIFSASFTTPSSGFTWWSVCMGFVTEVCLGLVVTSIIGVWYLCFSDNTNLGKNILQYMKAAKSGVCPLVDPPQSHKDAVRESQCNCGDG